jgi:hypothetical protein
MYTMWKIKKFKIFKNMVLLRKDPIFFIAYSIVIQDTQVHQVSSQSVQSMWPKS